MELASNFLRTRTASLGNLFKSPEAPLSPNKDVLISNPELLLKTEFILKPEVVLANKSEHFFPNKPDMIAQRKSEAPTSFTSSLAPRCLKPDVHYVQPDVCNVKAKPDVCNVKTTSTQKPDICAQVDEVSAKKYARKDSKSLAENAALPHVQQLAQRPTQQQQLQQERLVKERLKQHGQQSALPDRVKEPSAPKKSKVSLVV